MASNDSSSSSDVIVTLPNSITIRRYRLTDKTSLAYHANDKNIWDNLRNRMPHPYDESDAEAWINLNHDTSRWVASGPYTPAPNGGPGGTATGEPLPTNYAICINDEAVGSIGLEFGDVNEIYARSAEVGYWIGKAHWGKGIMGIVAPAFIEWAWITFGRLVRVNGCVMESNVGSRRCLEKAGFEMEGKRKMIYVKNGVFGNELVLGLVRAGMEEQLA